MEGIREEYKAIYLQAIGNGRSTLTAAPFFSLKTEAIKAALALCPEAALFDLRNGSSALISSSSKHLFIDAIEVLPLNTLAELILNLQNQKKIVHLVAHLYYYELVQPLLGQPVLLFPQLLSQAEQAKTKLLISQAAGKEKELLEKFIDYGDGWPGILRLLLPPETLALLTKALATFSGNEADGPGLNKFFRDLIRAYAGGFFSLLEKAQAVDKKALQHIFVLPLPAYEEYQQKKISLKDLIERAQPQLWHYVKFGFLWLAEEERILKVPRPIADFFYDQQPQA